MSVKTGKVLSVGFDVQIEKKDGGYYPGWQLVLSDNGKIENIAKHMNSLKFNPGLLTALESLVVGEDVTVHMEKKGAFLEVTGVTKGIDKVAEVTASAPVTKVAGSNYETKEERAARQRLIVRQSSFTSALEVVGPKDLDAVFQTAEKICNWVFEKRIEDLESEVL